MNEKKPISGKISLHGNGMGVPAPEDIERRARELAMIDERDPDQFTDADWSQAREELLGDLETLPPEEDETIGEQCVVDGLEEAAHDRMLEARREELEQEGEIL